MLATLVNIVSNEVHEFKYGNAKYICQPYGVYTLEELYRKEKEDSICRKSITKFYHKRKDLLHFSHNKFNVFQSYSMIFKNQRCLINIAGEKSYSEFLLEEGLAVKTPTKLDVEYDFHFTRLQDEARKMKKGLWGENIFNDCMSSINDK